MSIAGATMVCQTLKVVAMPSALICQRTGNHMFGMLSNLGLFWRMLCSMTIIEKLITQRNLLLVVIEGA
ncbi:hypothetical protein D8674_023138 [Pyrus ussuriensis x Pyrus communis]|uniref:Uncharacterized protein n=1 Tax=Pyrus ussuriensis x Pyrus communis TaxID=2448454 RepID=A0A5N5GTP3_9ROSA|nr:hypothetical protein D8674_023138 [Pyrus ussuriensis x Pyrus communis]